MSGEDFDTEPPLGTRIRMLNGRTFERTDPSYGFNWSDGIGWYRWSEVRGRALREDGKILITISTPVVLPVAVERGQGT